jgi:hypothetical protein
MFWEFGFQGENMKNKILVASVLVTFDFPLLPLPM